MKNNNILGNILNTSRNNKKLEDKVVIRPTPTPDILPYTKANNSKMNTYKQGLGNRLRNTNHYPNNEPTYKLHYNDTNNFNTDNENYNNYYFYDSSFKDLYYKMASNNSDKILKINAGKTISGQQQQKELEQKKSNENIAAPVQNNILSNSSCDKNIDSINKYDNDNINTLKGNDKQPSEIESEKSLIHPPQSIRINKYEYESLSNKNENNSYILNQNSDPIVTINIERIIIRGKNSNSIKPQLKKIPNNNSKGLSLNEYLNKRDRGKI